MRILPMLIPVKKQFREIMKRRVKKTSKGRVSYDEYKYINDVYGRIYSKNKTTDSPFVRSALDKYNSYQEYLKWLCILGQ